MNRNQVWEKRNQFWGKRNQFWEKRNQFWENGEKLDFDNPSGRFAYAENSEAPFPGAGPRANADVTRPGHIRVGSGARAWERCLAVLCVSKSSGRVVKIKLFAVFPELVPFFPELVPFSPELVPFFPDLVPVQASVPP